jgi:hypothetical protein
LRAHSELLEKRGADDVIEGLHRAPTILILTTVRPNITATKPQGSAPRRHCAEAAPVQFVGLPDRHGTKSPNQERRSVASIQKRAEMQEEIHQREAEDPFSAA